MKKYNIILLPALLAFLLCGCSQVTAANAGDNAGVSDEIETVSNEIQQGESDDTLILNLTDGADGQTGGEAQTLQDQLAQLELYIDELEKINDNLGLDLVMRLSDSEEIAGAYNEFCSMSAEEFRDEIIGRIKGKVTFILDEDGSMISAPHYIDVADKEDKLAQLQPYIDELEKINKELGATLAIELCTPYQIAVAYKEYCSMSPEEFADYITKLWNGEITVTYDEDGNKIIGYVDGADKIED